MAFSFTPQQQQPLQQSLFHSSFQQLTQFQPQQQQQQQPQSPFQLQIQQPQAQQPQPQPQPQQHLYLFTNDKFPTTCSTKWADLYPDSQKVLLQIEERIMEYRDESQWLDQCSRLYDSFVSNNGFEVDGSSIIQDLGGIRIAMESQKATLQELMAVVKDMLRNTKVAIRSYMMSRPKFLHQNKATVASTAVPSQPSGATTSQTTNVQTATNYTVPVLDFYSELPMKPSPFLEQTVARFEKYLSECRQWIEELKQLILLDSEKNCYNPSSSLLQSLPKVMANVHDFFVHVATNVESIHQYIESIKTTYLTDQHHRGDGNDPFFEADRRETAKHEAAARRVHLTFHLRVVSEPLGHVTGPFTVSAAPGAYTTTNTTVAVSASSGNGSLLFSTPAVASSTPSLFYTPTTSAPLSFLLGTAASPRSSPLVPCLFQHLPLAFPPPCLVQPLLLEPPLFQHLLQQEL